MTDVWFTADTHFFHKNICNYSNRPFKSLEEMEETLFYNWNKLVKPGDLIYHLGDFAMTWDKKEDAVKVDNLLKKLNGNKQLIIGNHDRAAVHQSKQWSLATNYKSIKVGNQKIILSHYCHRVWHHMHRGSWHLFGHSHGNLTLPENSGPCMDVGVDCCGFHPINFEEIKIFLSDKIAPDLDHHRRKE